MFRYAAILSILIYLESYIWYVSSGGLTGTIKMVDEIQSSLEK